MKNSSTNFYKWILLLMLGGAYFFHQADRAIFGVLTPYVQADLGLSEIQIGHITTILFITIAVVTFFAGFLGAAVVSLAGASFFTASFSFLFLKK